MKQKNIIIILIIAIVVSMFILREKKDKPSAVSDPYALMLSGFEDKKTWDISPEKGFRISLSKKHVTEGKYSLKVVYPKWGWPSINTKKLVKDWDDYEYFAFDVFNPQKETLKFFVRIDDINKKRTNIPYKLLPGLNRVKITRQKIASKINAGKIRFVVLFLEEPEKRYTLYFDNMYLKKSELIPGIERAKISFDQKNEPAAIPFRKAVVLPVKKAPAKGKVKFAVAKIKEVKDNTPFISFGIPFAPGQLKSENDFKITDEQGKELPIAVKLLAQWPQDKSVRSVLVQFKYQIDKVYEYVYLTWPAKRTLKELPVVEPRWAYPEGIIVMPKEWLCDSQVIGEQIPVGKSDFKGFDNKELKYFSKVKNMGWTGSVSKDAYYSTPHVFYQLFVRTGELKYFLAARKELLHYRDALIVNEGKDRGAPVSGNKGRYIYIDAMLDDYLLTGDPRSKEVAGFMVDYLKSHYPPSKAFYAKGRTNFWTERLMAFPFLGILHYYELTLDPQYLKLAHQYMENLYRTQMEWPARGGFIHNLYAHDPDEGARRDEYGGSPFMTGLLLEAIIKYHQITQSEIAADSIFRAVDWLLNEGLISAGNSFKYLTADKYLHSQGEPDINNTILHALGYAWRLSGYQENRYLSVGQKVYYRGIKDAYLGTRKHYNQNYRSSGHYLAYIYDGLILRAQQKKNQPVDEKKAAVAKDILVFEGFEHSLGRFYSPGDAALSIDKENVYLNGNALKIKSKFISSNMSAGVKADQWVIEKYPKLSFAYRIPQGTPVGLRLKTQFGDWVCLGHSPAGLCANAPVTSPVSLIDDGDWHEAEIDVGLMMKEFLPGIKRLNGFQFFTSGNAMMEHHFWIDEFKIRR